MEKKNVNQSAFSVSTFLVNRTRLKMVLKWKKGLLIRFFFSLMPQIFGSFEKPSVLWNSQLYTLGSKLTASACLRSLRSVNSGVTLRRAPNCMTALTFTHQSWEPNWYRPSLINALNGKSLTDLRWLFILFCHSAHQTCRSDMSVMAHLNSRA